MLNQSHRLIYCTHPYIVKQAEYVIKYKAHLSYIYKKQFDGGLFTKKATKKGKRRIHNQSSKLHL